MKWSWKVGEFKGIPIYIHTTFLIIVAWIVLEYLFNGQGVTQMAAAFLFVGSIFGCVLLHELGHALAAKRYGIATRDITLLPIGGVARLERMPHKPVQELWVALAGPAVNLVIAAGLFIWLQLTSGLEPLASLTVTTGPFLERLMLLNVILVVFNMLPAFPMDGGRVLRSLLALRFNYVLSTRIAAGLGQAMAVLFGILGFFFNPFLLVIAFFVWIGAGQEFRHAVMRDAFSGVPVPTAMETHFRTLGRNDDLESAVDRILAGSQRDFPVVDDGRVVGILTREMLLGALAHGDASQTTVGDVMGTDFQVIDSEETLDRVMDKLQEQESPLLPVLSHGRLVGLLTMQNLGEYMMIRSALQKAGELA